MTMFIHGTAIMSQPLQEFIMVQLLNVERRQIATVLWTKPTCLGCESFVGS